MNSLIDKLFPIFSQEEAGFWLPESASTNAIGVDITFYFILWVSVFFFFLNVILMLFFAYKYRRVEGKEPEHSSHHNTPLEITWTVIPVLIVLVMFWIGFKGYMELRVPPADSYEILVEGQKWNWYFTYNHPEFYVSQGELHVPKDRNVKLIMSSVDVLHAMYVPAFRVKQDVVPGRYTTLWFNANKVGTYDLFCAEYCGTDHSDMIGKVVVHEPAEFEAWLIDAANFIERIDPEAEDYIPQMIAAGETLYTRNCKQCHTIDGTLDDGPTFQAIFGKQETLTDGSSVLVDENYIRESILEPQALIVKGFDPVMPTFKGKLKDKEITAIIEYIKTLN